MRKEIRFSGSGGQGVILASVILGTAAALYENKHAVQSQSYGPEARGGASKSEVIIDTETIYHPHVIHPDLVLADEPSGNLDEANSAKLNELFGELNEKFNQAFLIVTHDEKLASFAKRRVVMHNGLIQDIG